MKAHLDRDRYKIEVHKQQGGYHKSPGLILDKNVFNVFSQEIDGNTVRKLAQRLKSIALECTDTKTAVKAAELIFKILAANEVINRSIEAGAKDTSRIPASHDILVKFQEEYENRNKIIESKDEGFLPE